MIQTVPDRRASFNYILYTTPSGDTQLHPPESPVGMSGLLSLATLWRESGCFDVIPSQQRQSKASWRFCSFQCKPRWFGVQVGAV